MPKRIALFILGVVLAVGAFLLYQLFSGSGGGSGNRPKATVTTPSTTLPMTIEERDPDGRLVYFITAPHAPEPIKDAAGNALPGQFRISNPIAQFYEKSGRLIQVEAETCDLAMATLPGAGGGLGGGGGLSILPMAGGKSAMRLDQISGSLYGHARLSIGVKPGIVKGDKDPFANGVRIYFDGPVKLDGASQQLTTDEGLHIRSETIEADQHGMKATFDQKTKTILSLRIGENPKGNQIIVRNMGEKAMNVLGDKNSGAETGHGGGNANAVAPTTSSATKPAEVPPIYRLTFGQDVLARAADRKLAAQNLSMIFSPTPELMGQNATQTAPAGPPAPVPLPLNATMPGLESIPLEVPPMGPPQAKDLVITWAGPLEMLPVDPALVKLSTPDEVILEAVGTREIPATVTKDAGATQRGFEALFGKLKYDTGHPIVLMPDEYNRVVLRGLSMAGGAATAPADAFQSEVVCGQVTLTQVDKEHFLAELLGPGVMTDKRMEKGAEVTSIIKWKNSMQLQLVPDPNDPKGNNLTVRSAAFDGGSITRNGPKGFDFSADTMDLLVANVAKVKDPQLEHMLATGNVKLVRHGLRPEDQGETFADRLEVLTQKGPPGQPPAISQMLADGHVTSWRYARDSSLVPGAAPAVAAIGPVNPATLYRKESLTAGRFAAALAPKPKSDTTAPATQASALGDVGEAFDIEHFVAQQNVRMEITPPPGSKRAGLLVTGDLLDSYPLKNSAVITAGTGPDDIVHVTHGTDVMEGRRLEVDKYKDTYNINCPGPGMFHVTLRPSDANKQPMPLDVTWQKQMHFDGANNLIVFEGSPVALAPGKLEDQAFLACDKTITVKLIKTEKSATRPAAAGTDDLDYDLEWLQAVGKVDVRGASYDVNNKLLSRIRLSATDSLKYTKKGDLIDIPGEGFMVIEDNRPDKANTQFSAAGETDFTWKGSLIRDDKGLITISKGVTFLFRPVKPLKFASSLGTSTSPRASGTQTAPPNPTYVLLQTENLTAMPKPPDPAAKKADNIVNVGADGMSRVTASGGPVLELGNYQSPFNAATRTAVMLINGNVMDMDMTKNLAVITGAGEDPAVIEHLARGEHFTGRRITVDTTKDQGGITVEDGRGNVTVRGQ